MYKRIVAVVLALVMLFSVTALAEETTESTTNLTEAEIASMAQLPAVKAYEILIDSFTTLSGEILYPDGYGGSYINDQNKLVIKIVEGFSSYQTELETLLQGRPIAFTTCTYSMYELVEYQSDAEEYAEYMVSSYINQENSVVRLLTSPDEASALNRSLMASRSRSVAELPYEIIELDTDEVEMEDASEQEQMPGIISPANVASVATLVGGDPIYKQVGSSTLILSPFGTIGIPGSFSWEDNCILTAGHVADSIYDLYLSYNDTAPLTKLYDNYTVGQRNSGDIGVLQYDGAMYAGSNTVYTSSASSVSYYYNRIMPPEGLYVHKYGVTTGLTWGYVNGALARSYTETSTFTSVEDLIPVQSLTNSHINDSGDSGGPVWCMQDDGSRVLLGIVSGRSKEGSVFFMLYTPIQQAVQIGFTPYGMTPTSTLVQTTE